MLNQNRQTIKLKLNQKFTNLAERNIFQANISTRAVRALEKNHSIKSKNRPDEK